MDSNDPIHLRKEEVHRLVASSNLPKALKRSMDFVSDFSTDRSRIKEVIALNRKYSELQDQYQEGQVDESSYQKENNLLVFNLLELLDQV